MGAVGLDALRCASKDFGCFDQGAAVVCSEAESCSGVLEVLSHRSKKRTAERSSSRLHR